MKSWKRPWFMLGYYVLMTPDCWIWTGPMNDRGYGAPQGTGAEKKSGAHRYIWQLVYGDVAKGLELDHLCNNRLCVKPEHLEPVTHAENVLRSYQRRAPQNNCKRGHEFNELNTYVTSRGYRCCRACMSLLNQEYRARRRQAQVTRKAGDEKRTTN